MGYLRPVQPSRRRLVTQLQADEEGLLIRGDGDFPVDVCFDGNRVLSFWLRRDTEERSGGRFYPWPTPLRPYLDGAVSVSVVDPADGTTWIETEVALGGGQGRIVVADKAGNRLAFDKSGRLTRLFGDRDASQMVPVLDAMKIVLDALEKSGVEPFLAYGTLLGAVRDQNFIGHDSDADLGYVSRCHTPAEAAMESFRLQRKLQQMGFTIERYSGIAFKVVVREADGRTRGLDVFGGFMREGALYLMGEVGVPFSEEWLYPRSTATLADREFPVPAVPDRLLEAMYGPSWQVPDPAFQFTTPPETVRRLNGWFRGMRVGYQRRWNDLREGTAPPARNEPSDFAMWVRREVGQRAELAVDLGCGTGSDALWLADEGISTIGLDYFPSDLREARRRVRRRTESGELTHAPEFEWANLLDLRSVMVTGARLARRPGPRVVPARHVADNTTRVGRENLLRLAKMVTRGDGRLYLQVQVAATPKAAAYGLQPQDLDAWAVLVGASGGRILESKMLSETDDGTDEAREGSSEPSLCRMVVSW